VNWPQVGTVQVLPDTDQDRHVRSKGCPCGPAVERWTVEGRRHVRVVHRELKVAEDDGPRAEDVLPGPRATHGVERSP
jgi:hypothetical protein